MALACYSAMLFMSHVLIFNLVKVESTYCPKEFSCGRLGSMSYPFTEFKKPYCGLSEIDCNNTFQYPKVELEGVSYNAYKKWLWVNGIDLSDSILEGYLAKRSCKSFEYLSPSEPVPSDLFDLLTSNFTLDWEVSKDCSKCIYRERQCQSDSKNDIFCSKEAKRNLGLILGSVISIVINIICCCKMGNRNFANVLPRSTRSEPSTQSYELDSGFFGVLVFSYAELQQATMNFDSFRELGDGGYDGREVAVKRLYENNARRKEQFITEIEILTRLRHKNRVTLYGCSLLTWPICVKIAVEAASALAYLHASGIIHRDLKSNNILLDQNFCVKVGDFGLSRLNLTDISHISTAPQGTPGNVDPKYHECYQFTDKSDVYSFGVVLIELISSMPAVDFSRHNEEINLSNYAINRILSLMQKVRRMTTSVAEISFRCLQHDKDIRPTMVEVLQSLQEILHGEFTCDKKMDCDGNTKESVQIPLSPESEVDVLLKKLKKFPTSPNSVTQVWTSVSSTSATST
ncbi:unnamed protein product [Withania somnifera]